MLKYYKELLAPLGAIRSRAMFGGHGIYCDVVFMAIVIDDQLYLKVDGLSQAEFQRAGCTPFVYHGKQGKPVAMSYWFDTGRGTGVGARDAAMGAVGDCGGAAQVSLEADGRPRWSARWRGDPVGADLLRESSREGT